MKFIEMAEQYMATKNWAESTRHTNLRLFELHIYPLFAEREIDDISISEIRDFILTIEESSTDMTHRIMSHLVSIFDRALVFEYCDINPAKPVCSILKAHKSNGFTYVKPCKMTSNCKKIDAFSNERYKEEINMIWLIIYTAQRLSEIHYLSWNEVDFKSSLLRIPASRMKTGREHLVPLPHQMLSLLILHKANKRSNKWVFPMKKDPSRPLWSSATRRVLVMSGCEITNHHGYRKTFSTHASESGLWSVDAIESQLSHQIAGVRGIYNKAQFIDERRKMMQWYADEIDRWRGTQ